MMKGFTYPTYGEEIIELFGTAEDNLLGAGRTSRVYSIDQLNVLRVYKPGTSKEYVDRLTKVLNAVDSSEVSFRVPKIEYSGSHKGSLYSVEERLGRNIQQQLGDLCEQDTLELLSEYLDALANFRRLKLDFASAGLKTTEPFFGEINGFDPLVRCSWSQFLLDRVSARLAISKPLLEPDFEGLDQLMQIWVDAVSALPNPSPELVHGDWSIVNVTSTADARFEAVIDFHEGAMIGDPLVDVAMAYLQFELCQPSRTLETFMYSEFRKRFDIDAHKFWIYAVMMCVDYARRKESNDVIYQFSLKYLRQALERFDGEKFAGLPGARQLAS